VARQTALALAVLTAAVAAGSGGAAPAPRTTAAAPPGFVAARTAIVREGRVVADFVRAADGDALYERFTPELAAELTEDDVKQTLAETLAEAPIGEALGESALPMAPSRGVYAADLRWGTRTLAFVLVLDARGEIAGIDLRARRPLPRDPRAGYRLKARLRLPVSGEWWVFWGGPTERQNYHVLGPDQRHAYDLVVWRSGATYRGTGAANAEYWAWGRPVVAPADGIVVAAVDGVRDNRPQVDVANRAAPAGNHVVIALGGGEDALLAHLRRGSVRVRAGQRVRQGTVLGLCGNSGNSSEPHLHFHVQDRPALFGAARGLPVAFRSYVADGRRIARGTPVQGQFIRP
jgi:murein DD-endopeptidase MepM/ murein hydrolase activator NlpD